MKTFEDIKNKVLSKFNTWIKINDNKSKWTIEDFPYETGVDEIVTNPHCWKCVTVNQCWFKDEEGKKPKEFDYSDYSLIEVPLSKRGLYHLNCHCKKSQMTAPQKEKIQFIIPIGKIDWMIKDKGHTIKEMGYKESEFLEVVKIIKNLISEKFVIGNYSFKAHDEKGYRIGFVLENFPGKNEDLGKFYKLKTGWSIFPNGKLKCNTLIGGLKK